MTSLSLLAGRTVADCMLRFKYGGGGVMHMPKMSPKLIQLSFSDLFSSTQTSFSTYDARMRTSPNLPTSDANTSTSLLTSDASTSPILPTTDNSTSTNSLTTDDSFDENRYTFPVYNVGCSLCVPYLIFICCVVCLLMLDPYSII